LPRDRKHGAVEADAKCLGGGVSAQLPEVAVFDPAAKNPQRATLPNLTRRRNPFREAFFEHPAGGRISFVRRQS